MERSLLLNVFKKEINKLKKEKFSDDDLNKIYNRIKKNIDRDLKDGYKKTLVRNLSSGIGVHAGEYPKHLILNGDKGGWKYITRFLLWEEHILSKLFSYKETPSRIIGGIIALATIWNMHDLAGLSRKYFQILFQENKEKYLTKEIHHLFISLLYDELVSERIDIELYETLPIDHVYRKIIDSRESNDNELIGNLVLDVCDYHIYSALDLKDKFSEILSLKYIPYEVMLIKMIRKKKGLNMPEVKHPLLETELANIPIIKSEWDLSNDEVYQYLVDRE